MKYTIKKIQGSSGEMYTEALISVTVTNNAKDRLGREGQQEQTEEKRRI